MKISNEKNPENNLTWLIWFKFHWCSMNDIKIEIILKKKKEKDQMITPS